MDYLFWHAGRTWRLFRMYRYFYPKGALAKLAIGFGVAMFLLMMGCFLSFAAH